MIRLCKIPIMVLILICFIGSFSWAGFKFKINDSTKGEIDFWTQAWYQYAEKASDSNGDNILDEDVNDFMIRRAYFSISGESTPYLSFFTHIAADRIGQNNLNDSSLGLGSGVAFRDLWITLKPSDALKLQVGRMYVPFTRNYGTTSTKSLLTTDLDWAQGGIRGNIFYPSKVGRDDGATLWGNLMEDKFQYRFMVGEGVENTSQNPDDNLRFAGRISANFFDAETGWFNQGTYLGKKRILAIGFGADSQELVFGSRTDDYLAWTVDVHYDQPLSNGGAITAEAAYIDIENVANSIKYTQLVPGDNGSIVSLKAGYLFPGNFGIGRLQPFAHYELINVDKTGKDDTQVYGLGLNYFFKGHANKLSLDISNVDQEQETISVQDHFVVTVQIAAGF
ncbi:MAG: selenite/tellurite reduction operon porin ExtI [Deltaproteobacteria bacterium]|jgi:hypothetical protein|nr:selenite/tellurite reduction operon porin ExtI [Deltaproteobacteria bacterium]